VLAGALLLQWTGSFLSNARIRYLRFSTLSLLNLRGRMRLKICGGKRFGQLHALD
jgi:hypothetical protein